MHTPERPIRRKPSAAAADDLPLFNTTAHRRSIGAGGPSARGWWATAALVVITLAGVALTRSDIPAPAGMALGVLALALVAWSVLQLDETPVALAAAITLVATGTTPVEQFFASLGDGLIWLLIGAFLIAAVLRQSGVAERLALRIVGRSATVAGLFWKLAAVIAATTFVVPSTSGRAALLLPVFLALAQSLAQPRIVRALALLFPSVILLSAAASMLGAGAHLIALDVMHRLGLGGIHFLRWMVLAAPFGMLSSAAATWLILRLFLSHEERVMRPTLPARNAAPFRRPERFVMAICLLTLVAWMASSWLGWHPTLVALGGALAVTWKPWTGVSMKDAIKGVEWNLILFMAATLVIGQALLDSGAAAWLARGTVQALPAGWLARPGLVAAVAVLVSMLSHLVITSRSARAAVLLPTLALPLAVGGMNPAALVLLLTLGSGYCQTLFVSAKPVALFARLDTPTYSDADLLRLSLWLMPPFALLLLASALWLWPALGLPLVAR